MCLKRRGCGSGRMPYENAMKRSYLRATCPWCTIRVYRTNIPTGSRTGSSLEQVYSRSACLIPAPSYTQNAPMGIDVSRKAVIPDLRHEDHSY